MRHHEYERDDESFPADAYRVAGWGAGIAFYVRGWEIEPGACEWYDDDAGEWMVDEDPEPVRTGRVIVTMIGDDARHSVDVEDITPLDREAYCGECGQIGCTHDGLDRDESEA